MVASISASSSSHSRSCFSMSFSAASRWSAGIVVFSGNPKSLRVGFLDGGLSNHLRCVLITKKALIFVTANQVEEALTLYDAGADYVILPHLLGGDHVSILLEDFTGDINKILKTKLKHIDELHRRRELGHEHPMNLNYNA